VTASHAQLRGQVTSQDSPLWLHGMNRDWKPAYSPLKQSFLRSRGEHVFTDSSLTNINPPASCLLRNRVKWKSVNINK
jgi:hypothetical protein